MALTTWNPQYSVNVPELDAQHQRWFELLNELHAAMIAGAGREVMGQVLAGLVDYTKMHFAAEERLLTAHGYPDLARHKQVHAAMTAQILDYQAQVRAGKIGVTISLLQTLKKWLQEHILGTDRLYGEYLSKRRVA